MKKRILLLILIVSAFGASLAEAQTTKRVQFPKGSETVRLNGAVKIGAKDTYIVRARKGQRIVVDLTFLGRELDRDEDDDQGSSGLDYVLPNGEEVMDAQDNEIYADRTGDYKIIVNPAYRMSSPKYVLKLTLR